MNEMQVLGSRKRASKSAAPLFLGLSIAGGIGFAGLIALVVASFEYTRFWGCPDDAWPDVASAIAVFTLIPAGIFVLLALRQIPLIWAGGPSQAIARAVIAGILAALVAALLTVVVWGWLDALASADCVEEPGSFMRSIAWQNTA